MEDYLSIANSSFIYLLGIIMVCFVMIQSFIFLKRAWKEGLKIGLSKKVMMNAIKSSAIFSIVPSLPIIISLIAMAPVLGLPFPWIRLSVVGSAPYELLSANVGAQSMGIKGLGGAGYTAEVFANSMWVMSFGIIWGLLLVILFLKKLQTKMKTIKKKDSRWLEILISSLYFGMLSVFIGQPVVEGGVPLATIFSSAAIMIFLTYIIKRFKIKWLNNFALAISMVGSMALAIVYSNL